MAGSSGSTRRVGVLVLSLALVAGLLVASSGSAVATTGVITTVAGSVGEGPATGVAQQPSGVALRGTSLYVSDTHNHVVRVIDIGTGQARVIAGTGAEGSRGDGGPATAAGLNAPEGIDLDAAGNLYVADSGNGRIRRVSPSGQITTVAGDGGWNGLGDGGPATRADLHYPMDVAVDGSGNLFIADYFHHRVRKVDPAGTITTVAGTGVASFGGDGGPATAARLSRPAGLALDRAGNLYVADFSNHRVRRVDPAGIITTVAGNGSRGRTGDGGPATQAAVEEPERVEVDGAGNLHVAQTRGPSAIRRVDAQGTITTVAAGGTGVVGDPRGMVFDGAGNLYFAGIWFSDYRVHKLTPSGTMTTVAGTGRPAFSGDGGPAVAAQLSEQTRVTLGPGGELYIADLGNDRIRRVAGSGTITTVVTADFNISGAIAFDSDGSLYVAEPEQVRRIDPSGLSTVVAGTGTTGFSGDGGPATAAEINYPSGLALDGLGNLYLADSGNHRVRRVGPDGVITTVAGGGSGALGDGGPATAATLDLHLQAGVAVDSRGNLFVADSSHQRVRRVGADGIITTVAGNGEYYGPPGDGGPATGAAVGAPGGLTVDGADNLYIAAGASSRVRKVDTTGVISTVAGNGEVGYAGDGGQATDAEVNLNGSNAGDAGLAVTGSGDLLIAEARRVRRVMGIAVPVPELPGTTSTSTSTSTTMPSTSTSTSTTTTPAPIARARGWGLNHLGELGNGTVAGTSSPSGAGTVPGTTEVAAGLYHSVARRNDGTVWAWGSNGYGQLGDGTIVDRHAPVQVSGLSKVVSVAAGATHTLALRDDGTVWAWGWNGVGQLGSGTTVDRRSPVQVPGLTGVVAVSAGAFHSIALLNDGTVTAWGWNHYGQLGVPPISAGLNPVRVAGLGSVRAVAAGGYHSLAVLTDGTVRAWGWNAYGQLGTGTVTDAREPVTVGGLTGATTVAAGLVHSLTARSDGTVRAWGWNGVGQLGDGTTVDRRTPVAAGPLAGVQRVAAGAYHSLALGPGGSVTAWGWNAFGQLGDGTLVNRSRPTARPFGTGGISISGGAGHSLAAA